MTLRGERRLFFLPERSKYAGFWLQTAREERQQREAAHSDVQPPSVKIAHVRVCVSTHQEIDLMNYLAALYLHGVCFPRRGLAIGKDGPIVSTQHICNERSSKNVLKAKRTPAGCSSSAGPRSPVTTVYRLPRKSENFICALSYGVVIKMEMSFTTGYN